MKELVDDKTGRCIKWIDFIEIKVKNCDDLYIEHIQRCDNIHYDIPFVGIILAISFVLALKEELL